MFRTILTGLILLFVLPLAALPADELLQKGLGEYQKHDYDSARDTFERALKLAPGNTRLLHNLALTFYQLNQKPRAVALWRKALAIDPGYRAAQAGRDLMESRMNMRAFERDPVDLLINRTLESLSYLELNLIGALALLITGWLWIRYFAAKHRARDEHADAPPVPWAAASTGVVALAGLIVIGWKFSMNPRATVVVESAAVRSIPADEGVSLFEVPGGTEVLVKARQSGWRQIENPEGNTGWIRDGDLVPTSEG